MYKLRHVYICNLCQTPALPIKDYTMLGERVMLPPKGWETKGKVHICSACVEILKENPKWRAEFD